MVWVDSNFSGDATEPFGKKASGVLAAIDLLAAIIDRRAIRIKVDGHFLPRALETKGEGAAGPEKLRIDNSNDYSL